MELKGGFFGIDSREGLVDGVGRVVKEKIMESQK